MGDLSVVEDTLKRISSHKGILGSVIINGDGIPIRSTFNAAETQQYAAHVSCLAAKIRAAVRSLDRGGDAADELHVVRVRSRRHEILIAPNYERGQDLDKYDVEDGVPEEEPQPKAKAGKGAPVLPWMRLPVNIEPGAGMPLESVKGLDARLLASLHACGYTELFPVQAAAWRETAGGRSAAHDLCICAPTGSGKTLAYALPIVAALAGRLVPRLRALVVLPTRDLAAQGTVDILVATPGRLMAHLRGTPGIGLEHLRFLVVDEMDRLLRQSYQNWLPHVVEATTRPQAASADPITACSSGRGRVVKVVASATLTRDPAKIERLALHCPRYLALTAADHRYALPRELHEYKVVCAGADKPLVALVLLQALAAERVIVFTASIESTQRLGRLLQALPGVAPPAAAFSSAEGPAARAAALSAFQSGAARVLVASDALTRGMDVAGVGAVINYDAPTFAKTYVHRAGRTARAGQHGRVFTLLRPEDVRHFKGLLRKVDNAYVKDYKLPSAALTSLRPQVDAALASVLPAAQ
ncbi:hypothetical protein WJX81_005661 [Elliptochloris bilobata]|uniref:ATP-dependent RNA helicase n=1 Tax=Elliptochloris bilobata TaxID=381761 RepID=A0AAW1QIL7_9CHLO